jgi:hypothetical protein
MSTYHKGDKITDFYKLEDEIGRYLNINVYFCRGSFAIVKSGVNKKTGERVAIKIIER